MTGYDHKSAVQRKALLVLKVLYSDIQQIQNPLHRPPSRCQNVICLLYGQDSNNVMIAMLNISIFWENERLLRLTDGSPYYQLCP